MHIFLFWMIFIDIDMNSIDQFIHYIDSSNSNVLKEKIELLSTTITVMSFLFGISFIGISTDEKEINFSKKTKDFIFVLGFFLFINGFVSFFSFLLIEISL